MRVLCVFLILLIPSKLIAAEKLIIQFKEPSKMIAAQKVKLAIENQFSLKLKLEKYREQSGSYIFVTDTEISDEQVENIAQAFSMDIQYIKKLTTKKNKKKIKQENIKAVR